MSFLLKNLENKIIDNNQKIYLDNKNNHHHYKVARHFEPSESIEYLSVAFGVFFELFVVQTVYVSVDVSVKLGGLFVAGAVFFNVSTALGVDGLPHLFKVQRRHILDGTLHPPEGTAGNLITQHFHLLGKFLGASVVILQRITGLGAEIFHHAVLHRFNGSGNFV